MTAAKFCISWAYSVESLLPSPHDSSLSLNTLTIRRRYNNNNNNNNNNHDNVYGAVIMT